MSKRWGGVFDIPAKRNELIQKQEKILTSDFWGDTKKAEAFLKDVSNIKFWVKGYDEISELLSDLEVLSDFGEDAQDDLPAAYKLLEDKITVLELRNMLSAEGDNLGALLKI
ncbi:MAG: PCRF domain-containing protein, partial [Bacteroidales bacterium]